MGGRVLTLYGYRSGRTLRVLWAMEEVAAEFKYVEVDLKRGEGRQPSFLSINPAGKVPVLIDGEQVITESAAICMHLADKYPASGLLPPAGTSARSACYESISIVITELDAPLWTIAKHRFALPKEKRVPAAIDTAIWEFCVAADVLAARLGTRYYLCGDSFTVADILAGHTLLWARSARISWTSPQLGMYLERLLQRPALMRARDRTTR